MARPLHTGPINQIVPCRFGLVICNRQDSWIGRSLALYGEYCPAEGRLFERLVGPGMVVVEVGANLGAHTVRLAQLVGSEGTLLAFEPQEPVFQLLAANVALNSLLNVRCLRQGVGAEPGRLALPAVDYYSWANFGNVALQPAAADEERSVEVVTIDSLDLPRCDFLKIDVEGMEWDVLRGAARTIERHLPMLYLENDDPERSAKITRWLGELGYRMHWFVPPYFEADNYQQNPKNVFGDFANVCLVAVHGDAPRLDELEAAAPGAKGPRNKTPRMNLLKAAPTAVDATAPAAILPGAEGLTEKEQRQVLAGQPLERRPHVAQPQQWQVEVPDRKRCVILVPTAGNPQPACEAALQALERKGYAAWRVRGYSAIDQGRNQMATDALAQGFDETFWIDDDVGFEPADVDRMRCLGLPLCAAIYPKKGKRELAAHVLPGTKKIVFGEAGGLLELKYTATGFLHVRREVYETIQRRLELPTCNLGFGSAMIPFFQPLIVPTEKGPWYLAEDYAFCERARRCGYQIMADTRVRLYHIGTYGYSWEEAGEDRQRYGTYGYHL